MSCAFQGQNLHCLSVVPEEYPSGAVVGIGGVASLRVCVGEDVLLDIIVLPWWGEDASLGD